MNKLIILKYMEKLTKEDIKKYIDKEKLMINDDEVNIIYLYLKKDSEKVLNNTQEVINELKDIISMEAYNTLINLYQKYKNKIS